MRKFLAASVLTLSLCVSADAGICPHCGRDHAVTVQRVHYRPVTRRSRTIPIIGHLWNMEKHKNAWLMRHFPNTIGRMTFLPTP